MPVILATIRYGETPRKRMGHATALATIGQQFSVALGVTLAASLLEAMHGLHAQGAASLAVADFRVPLAAMAAIPFVSVLAFVRLARGDVLDAVRSRAWVAVPQLRAGSWGSLTLTTSLRGPADCACSRGCACRTLRVPYAARGVGCASRRLG